MYEEFFDIDFNKHSTLDNNLNITTVNRSIETTKYPESKKAIFCGSFDPFTNGHLSIVKKASQIFDKLYVVIAVNYNKNRKTNKLSMIEGINKTLQKEGITNCIVDYTYDLVAEYCKKHNIKYFVRGLRNNMDYNYEENIAEVNKLLNEDLEYIYFRADNKAISSSMINELLTFKKDVSKWIPEEVLKCLKEDN